MLMPASEAAVARKDAEEERADDDGEKEEEEEEVEQGMLKLLIRKTHRKIHKTYVHSCTVCTLMHKKQF